MSDPGPVTAIPCLGWCQKYVHKGIFHAQPMQLSIPENVPGLNH